VLLVNNGANITVTGSVSGNRRIDINTDATATVTLNNVSIDTSTVNWPPIWVSNRATLNLVLASGTTNTLTAGVGTGGADRAGLLLRDNSTLNISGTGTLNATGGANWPGIGGEYARKTITINSGAINATGGANAAGIGGWYGAGGTGGTITINGGTVRANGGSMGAGIGGGRGRDGGTILISNGNVTARGGSNYGDSGAGIGGGHGAAGGNITINGGTVNATSGAMSAGIGGGHSGAGGTINISGGTVTATATGDSGGAGIGSGYNGSGGAVTISGGTVTAQGSTWGAGIGGGDRSTGGTVTLSGGIVTANGFRGVGAGSGASACDLNMNNSNGGGILFANNVTSTGTRTGGVMVVGATNPTTTWYSNVTLQSNSTLPSGHTLTIPSGRTLSVANGRTLTNNGTIIVQNGGQFRNNLGGAIVNNGMIYDYGSDAQSVGTIAGNFSGNPVVGPRFFDLSHSYPNGFDTTRWSFNNNVFTIKSGATVTVTGSNQSPSPSQRRIEVAQNATGVNLTLSGVTITGLGSSQSALLLNAGADVTLTLAAGTVNTLTAGGSRAGIQTAGATLTINGAGSLQATGGYAGAGIGGGSGGAVGAGGTITITGGTVTARGGDYGAGIGGGSGGAGGTITINGGTVTARGGNYGAGIGGGSGGAGGTLAMNGDGVVFASSVSDASAKTRGILFNGDEGTFYGSSVTPTENVVIPAGHTLTVPVGATLTIPYGQSITNNGLVWNAGTIHHDGAGMYGAWLGFPYMTGMPGTAGAIDLSDPTPAVVGNGWTYSNGLYTIYRSANVTVTGSNQQPSPSQRRIEVAQNATGVNITLDGAIITGLGENQSALLLNAGADVTLTLAAGTVNTLTGGTNWAGIQTTSATLAIDGTGSLQARGGYLAAGIGGFRVGSGGTNGGGTLTIHNGTITATGGVGGAGIGGGYRGEGGAITIRGGVVTATGGVDGAGIGGGSGGEGGTITIRGGVVTATGGDKGAGIGGGRGGAGDRVFINGGVVTATGGDRGAGIGGGGAGGAGGAVTISGGVVTATGVDGGAGIGAGVEGNSGGMLYMSAHGVAFASSLTNSGNVTTNTNGVVRGILFVNNAGTFYGASVTPTEDVVIPAGATLTVPSGVTLTIPDGQSITNHGEVWKVGDIFHDVPGTHGLWLGNPYLVAAPAVTGISIERQPTLHYTTGNALDLTAMQVRLTFEDATTKRVGFADFAANDIETLPLNGTILDVATHDGTRVTAIYDNSATIRATTNPLVVTPAGVAVVIDIAVKTQPTLSYTEGERLDLSAMVVTLTYSDGAGRDVAFADFAADDITTDPEDGETLDAATHDATTVTVIYDGSTTIRAETDPLSVVVPPATVESLTITTPPRLAYSAGDLLDLSAMEVTLRYSDGTDTVVAFADFAANDIETDPLNGTILDVATHDGTRVTAIYDNSATIRAETGALTVTSAIVPVVNGIAVKTQPTLSYTAGDLLDLSTMVVTLTYNNGSQTDVAFADFAANDISTDPLNGTVLSVAAHDGTRVEVIYDNSAIRTETELLWVTPPPVTVDSIAVTTQPTLAYTAGDALDLTAMVVTLTYSNGATQPVEFAYFGDWEITATPTNGTMLLPAHHGTTVRVIYDNSATIRAETGALTVALPATPTILTRQAGVPTGRVGQAYSLPLFAIGGTPPYTWSISSGSLPPGLSLNAATGEISGTPTATGAGSAYSFAVTVTDAASLASAPVNFNIAIAPMAGGVAAIPALGPMGLVLLVLALGLSGIRGQRSGIRKTISSQRTQGNA